MIIMGNKISHTLYLPNYCVFGVYTGPGSD